MTTNEQESEPARSGNDLREALHSILLGSNETGPRRNQLIGFAILLFGLTFLAYELDVFYHSGGVVFIPFHAAIVGVIAAFWAGYRRNGMFVGWGLTYISFLGWRAEWATDISARPLLERVYYVVRPDGLLALAFIGLVVAVVGFTAGALIRKGNDTLRAGR